MGNRFLVPSTTPGQQGGMTLLSTTTLSGASVTISSIPQTYKNLQLVIQNYKPAVDAPDKATAINPSVNLPSVVPLSHQPMVIDSPWFIKYPH